MNKRYDLADILLIVAAMTTLYTEDVLTISCGIFAILATLIRSARKIKS
jgi:hypothetical protein